MIPLIYLACHTLRADRGGEPMASTGARVADCLAAPTENFLTTPIVTHEAYEFAPPEHKEVVGVRATATG